MLDGRGEAHILDGLLNIFRIEAGEQVSQIQEVDQAPLLHGGESMAAALLYSGQFVGDGEDVHAATPRQFNCFPASSAAAISGARVGAA